MAIKDQRTNKYAGAIGIVAPSNARVNRKQQESEFFANMADNIAKDEYASAVAKGKIQATLAADSYNFTKQLQKFDITDTDGSTTTYEKEVPVPYKFPQELEQFADTVTFDEYQSKIAKRYINELETISSDIILKEESRAIMDGVDQMSFENGLRGPLQDFYETLTPNVSNILKLSDEKLIIQRGRIVQNNYNEIQLSELNKFNTDAISKSRTEAFDLLTEGQSVQGAIDLYSDKMSSSTGSKRFINDQVQKQKQILKDMEKVYKLIEPHIVKHGEEEDIDKLANTSIIANGYLKGQRSVTLSNGTRLDISALSDVSGEAINSVANRLEVVAGSNSKYQQQMMNRNAIRNSIKANGIRNFGVKTGKKPKEIADMLDADPKFINELYDIFLQEVPEDSAIIPTRDNPLADSRFRILMFNQGIVPSALRENISNALDSNDPELINQQIPIIIELKNSRIQPSRMGFTETNETKINALGRAMSASPDGSINTRRILEFTQSVTNAKELGVDGMMEEYRRQVKDRFGSIAKFHEDIGTKFDDYINSLPAELRNGLDDVYYGEVVMSRVMEAISKEVNMGGTNISDDMIEDTIATEVNNMLGSNQYGFSTRGVSFRRLGNPEDDFGIGDVINPLQYVPDFIYNADAVNRKGTFMYNPPEVHHGIAGSVEYLVPFAAQKVKNYFTELQKENPSILMPENIEDQIRFIPNEGTTGVDLLIILLTPSGEEQTLSGGEGMLKLENNLIQKIKGDLDG